MNNIMTIGKVRNDGLRVFFDDDVELNKIRLTEPDRRKVILAVAIRRAQQIAVNYAKRHAPDLVAEIEKLITRKCKLLERKKVN